MKFLPLLLLGLMTSSALAQTTSTINLAEYERLNQEATRKYSYTLSLFNLEALLLTAGTVETVREHPDYFISCSHGWNVALLEDWLALDKTTQPLKGDKPDVRVVLANQDDVVGFTGSGEDGYWNGVPVHFSAPMQQWYQKHIRPLAQTLFMPPPKKK